MAILPFLKFKIDKYTPHKLARAVYVADHTIMENCLSREPKFPPTTFLVNCKNFKKPTHILAFLLVARICVLCSL